MTSQRPLDVDRYRLTSGKKVDLTSWDPEDKGAFGDDRAAGEAQLALIADELAHLQALLYAQHRHRVLLVLQGMDTSGKDGTIRKVFREVGPLGVDVANFKKPNDDELARDYLWRVHQHTPAAGHLTVFNRSHYEDVLIVRVHGLFPPDVVERRYAHIADFERMLCEEGVRVVKCMLHISKDAQKERLQARLDDPHKQWKFDHGDLSEREKWDDYQRAYEIALARTSTDYAPWYVIPSDRKWYRNLMVGELVRQTLLGLDMEWPKPTEKLDGIVID